MVDGAEFVRQWREVDRRCGWGEREMENPEEASQRAEVVHARLRALSARWWRGVAGVASGIDGALRKAAGEGNEILYRFFQVLLYVGVPILLAILVSAARAK